jgi:hypothetical protein
LLAESVVLSLLAGGAGVLLATWGRSLLLGTLVPRDLWVGGVETNARVLGFGVLVSLLTGVVFGLRWKRGGSHHTSTSACSEITLPNRRRS